MCVRVHVCVCVRARACALQSKWLWGKNVFVIVPSTLPCRQHCQLKGRFYVLRAGSVAVCGCAPLAAGPLPGPSPGDQAACSLYCHGQMKGKHNTPLIRPRIQSTYWKRCVCVCCMRARESRLCLSASREISEWHSEGVPRPLVCVLSARWM